MRINDYSGKTNKSRLFESAVSWSFRLAGNKKAVIFLLTTYTILKENRSKEMSRDDVLQKLKEYKESSPPKYGIRRLGLFGSMVREEASPESDLDIVIEMDKADLFIMGEIQQDLEDKLGISVDLIRIRENMNPFLKERICKEAVYV